MDRNSIIGLVLIGAILVLFSIYNAPTEEQIKRQKQIQDSILALKNKQTTDSLAKISSQQQVVSSDTISHNDSSFVALADTNKNNLLTDQFGVFAKSAEGKEEFFTVENEVLKITFTNKGGRVYKVELKKYLTHDSLPLILCDGDDNRFNYQFFASNRNISTQDLFFQKTGEEFSIKGEEKKSIAFRLYAGDGNFIEQKWTLTGNSYLLEYDFNITGFDEVIPKNTNFIGLNWKTKIRNQEKNLENEHNTTTIYYKYSNEKPDYLSETEEKEEKLTTSVEWISFKQQFFNHSLIAKNKFDAGTVVTKNNSEKGIVKNLSADLIIPYNHEKDFSFPMQFYFGPNHYQTLKKFDNDLEKIIPLGWVLFRWINKFAIIPTFNFLNQYISNYGIIILILTILLKIVLSPFNYKSFLSMAKMNVLKPEIEELKKKYGDDQTRMSQESMKLYQKAGVNPMGGCLPMILSMPIMIAMYIFFPSSIELRQEPFLWAKDLSTYDSIIDLSFTIPFYGNHVSLFTLLMTVSSILYAHFNMQMSAQMNAQMKWMQYIFPIMLLGVFNQLSAALTYYYFLTNMLSFAQQFIIKKYFINEEAIHRQIEENKKKPMKKSGWQARLEDYAKKQQQKRK